jgi:hypothetical protein
MKKIIPFKKEILFKTRLKEVTSISLEHDYKINDDVISGEFLISGDYKITASSINREEFSYKIPFEIAIDSRYDTKTMNLDIENFYYEIINEEILKVNIDVFVEGEYKKDEAEKIVVESNSKDNSILEENADNRSIIGNNNEVLDNDIDNNLVEQIKEETNLELNNFTEEKIKNNILDIDDSNIDSGNKNINIINNNPINNINNNINSKKNINPSSVNLFDNISMEDTYSTYYVYIVKEGDNIDDILNKYNITKEELENYNDISSIKPFDKLVIPSHNE